MNTPGVTTMKTIFLLWAAIFAFTLSPAQSAQDEQRVGKVILSFQDDFNEGGFKNAAAYTTDDWEHLNPLGFITKGRDEVLKEVRAVHQGFLKGITMSIETMDIRFITNDVAIANVVHAMGTYEMPPGVKHENERHLKTYMVVKKDGKWLLTHDQNTIRVHP
jgi:uncharacterized protein (TIGR02246 family)